MKLLAFRIKNFRSIIDTGWHQFSADGVTVLVGQNESGKTSILEALTKALDPENRIVSDDIRLASDLPQVYFKAQFDDEDLDSALSDYNDATRTLVTKHYKKERYVVALRCFWEPVDDGSYKLSVGIDDPEFVKEIERISKGKNQNSPEALIEPDSSETDEAVKDTQITSELNIGWSLYVETPQVTLFQAKSGILPNFVDINDKGVLTGESAVAARNYLAVAGIDIAKLIGSDLRTRSGTLRRANEHISRDFSRFWSQTIGDSTQLQLESELQTYGADAGEKSGKPFLVFWISDGLNKLHPSQRSLGVQWFISFYLQLKATDKSDKHRLFLLDEPGANLHAKAQQDVLKLINQLQKDIQIVYSTHNPDLIEYEKLYRILVIQRRGDRDDSPSEIIDAHRLSSASRDSLSPILSAMGADLSHQQVIRKGRNVILEEISAFYYFTAFWHLLKRKEIAHFIAATGVDNVEPLANMFLGWGLSFIVAVDDDPHGRAVYNKLKRDFFGEDETSASGRMLKFSGCLGIEDIFSMGDFCKFILRKDAVMGAMKNSEFVKKNAMPKAVLAYQFQLSVLDNKVSWGDLDQETQQRISKVVNDLIARLPNAESS